MHIITGLNNGGAEGVLFRLCKHDKKNEHIVISMMDMGKYGSMLLESGIEVVCLNLSPGSVTLAGIRKLYKIIKQNKPDVVQTWMYHADLIGGVIAKFAGVKNIFWNIRHTTLEAGHSKKSTIYIAKLCALLSYFIPKKIVCCANKAVEIHSALGYSKKKMQVIANGFELDRLVIDQQLGESVRSELSLSSDCFVFGMVGRYDPQKDHVTLLESLSILREKKIEFKCLLIGRDLDESNLVLSNEIKRLHLKENILLLEQRSDIPAIMNALDIHILSSSFGEAFPNVLAEAMACGTPCVTTDVGDAAVIVGSTGWVVPPSSPQSLAEAVVKACNEKSNRKEWGFRQKLARKRVIENFSIENMINLYHQVWNSNNLF